MHVTAVTSPVYGNCTSVTQTVAKLLQQIVVQSSQVQKHKQGSTCYRSSSHRCARHGQPSCQGKASRTHCGTGCTPYACTPGPSLWAACIWGRAWCLPVSSWHSHSQRCSCEATCSQLHSPPVQRPRDTVQRLAGSEGLPDATQGVQKHALCTV